MQSLLRKLLGEDILLTYSYEKEVIPIVADCRHMEQVLMNLAANARDAMPDGGSASWPFTSGTAPANASLRTSASTSSPLVGRTALPVFPGL